MTQGRTLLVASVLLAITAAPVGGFLRFHFVDFCLCLQGHCLRVRVRRQFRHIAEELRHIPTGDHIARTEMLEHDALAHANFLNFYFD